MIANFIKEDGVPTGIRTPVTAVKGRCPRPLDDGDLLRKHVQVSINKIKGNFLILKIISINPFSGWVTVQHQPLESVEKP